ncbi:1193_t:CDS:2, partial [Dentiscutata heterogama]
KLDLEKTLSRERDELTQIKDDLVSAQKALSEKDFLLQEANACLAEQISKASSETNRVIGGISGLEKDVSKIAGRYTDDVKGASMVINSYLRKGEFVVFDLSRPEDDPLAIQLRFDTLLNLQKEIEARQKYKEKSTSPNK